MTGFKTSGKHILGEFIKIILGLILDPGCWSQITYKKSQRMKHTMVLFTRYIQMCAQEGEGSGYGSIRTKLIPLQTEVAQSVSTSPQNQHTKRLW